MMIPEHDTDILQKQATILRGWSEAELIDTISQELAKRVANGCIHVGNAMMVRMLKLLIEEMSMPDFVEHADMMHDAFVSFKELAEMTTAEDFS